MSLIDSFFDAMQLMKKDKGCDWYCDGCGEYLNDQPGFTTRNNTWTCTECGFVNDVSITNIKPAGYDPNYDEDYTDYNLGIFDEDDMPDCCRACGNPAFPDCQSGCPIFDD